MARLSLPGWLRRELPVQMAVLFYFAGEYVVMTTAVPYVTYGVCHDVVPNATSVLCLHINRHPEQEALVQRRSAVLLLLERCVSAVPPLLLSAVLGPWSDRHGRRLPLLLPFLGNLLAAGLFLTAVQLWAAPVTALIMAGFGVRAVSGNFVVVHLIAFSHLADVIRDDAPPVTSHPGERSALAESGEVKRYGVGEDIHTGQGDRGAGHVNNRFLGSMSRLHVAGTCGMVGGAGVAWGVQRTLGGPASLVMGAAVLLVGAVVVVVGIKDHRPLREGEEEEEGEGWARGVGEGGPKINAGLERGEIGVDRAGACADVAAGLETGEIRVDSAWVYGDLTARAVSERDEAYGVVTARAVSERGEAYGDVTARAVSERDGVYGDLTARAVSERGEAYGVVTARAVSERGEAYGDVTARAVSERDEAYGDVTARAVSKRGWVYGDVTARVVSERGEAYGDVASGTWLTREGITIGGTSEQETNVFGQGRGTETGVGAVLDNSGGSHCCRIEDYERGDLISGADRAEANVEEAEFYGCGCLTGGARSLRKSAAPLESGGMLNSAGRAVEQVGERDDSASVSSSEAFPSQGRYVRVHGDAVDSAEKKPKETRFRRLASVLSSRSAHRGLSREDAGACHNGGGDVLTDQAGREANGAGEGVEYHQGGQGDAKAAHSDRRSLCWAGQATSRLHYKACGYCTQDGVLNRLQHEKGGVLSRLDHEKGSVLSRLDHEKGSVPHRLWWHRGVGGLFRKALGKTRDYLSCHGLGVAPGLMWRCFAVKLVAFAVNEGRDVITPLWVQRPPLSWANSELAGYLAAHSVANSALLLLLAPRVSDRTLVGLGLAGGTAGGVWMALAPSSLAFVAAGCFSHALNGVFPALRAILTNGMQRHQVGGALARMSVAECLACLLGPLVMVALYTDPSLPPALPLLLSSAPTLALLVVGGLVNVLARRGAQSEAAR